MGGDVLPDRGMPTESDAGELSDAGSLDSPDEGLPPRPTADGGCQAQSGGTPWSLLGLSVLLWGAARRRRYRHGRG